MQYTTHQLTSMAALLSAMKGSSPYTLQKPKSKIHQSRMLAVAGCQTRRPGQGSASKAAAVAVEWGALGLRRQLMWERVRDGEEGGDGWRMEDHR